MYLYSFATRGKEDTAYRVLQEQWNGPKVKDDWAGSVRKDLKDLGLQVDNIDDLEKISKREFKETVSKEIERFALGELVKVKETHSKLNSLKYDDLKMREYLKDKSTTYQEKILTMKWRLRMADFGENFKAGRDKTECPLCGLHKDSQEESFECELIRMKLIQERNIQIFLRIK